MPHRGRGGRGGGGRGGRRGSRGGYRGGGGGCGADPEDIIYNSGAAAAVDSRVTQVEDELVASRFTLPLRPDYGTEGIATCVRANYFPVALPTKTLFRYDVSMSPEPRIKRIRMRIFQLLESGSFQAAQNLMATDYFRTIITAERLPLPNNKLRLEVRYYDGDQQGPDEKSKVYVCTISLVQHIELDRLQDFVDGRSPDFEPWRAIQALNIILAKPRSPNPGLTQEKMNFFIRESKPSMNLNQGLVAFQGYYTCIRPSVGRVLCNVNVRYAAFYRRCNLATLMRDYGISPQLRLFLKGLRISTNHIRDATGRPKVQEKLIFGLSNQNPTQVSFILVEGNGRTETTLSRYFYQKHNITLQQADLPCVNVGTRKNPILLPPELATVLPGQPCRRKLSCDQTREMVKHARRSPRQNAEDIVRRGLPNFGLGKHHSALLDPFNLRMSTEMISVPARILLAPTVVYGGGPQTVGASWNLKDVRFLRGSSAKSWACVVIGDGGESAVEICERLREACGKSGVNLPILQSQMIVTVRTPDYSQMTSCFTNLKRGGAQIILVLLPSKDRATYALLKTVGDVKVGISTVCALMSKIRRVGPHYFGNLALKFNLKLGGMNHGLPKEHLGMLSDHPTMIPIIEIDQMMVECLEAFNKQNNRLPDSIIVYRKGAWEGVSELVLNMELPKIREACARVRAGYKPKVTIIVVRRRHDTRFYPTDKTKADTNGNPAPGTVVDRGITAVYGFDFYLQAHAGLLGTTRPAHYHVIQDENAFRANSLQTLTHNLCYLYGRATKAVSICTPAYYADLLCKRGRYYMYRPHNPYDGSVRNSSSGMWGAGPHPDILKTMYYL